MSRGALDALARLVEQARRPRRGVPDVGEPVEPVAGDGYFEARELLEAAGIPFAPARRIGSNADAVTAAAALGYPVALKALGLLHKSDSGGVALGLAGEGALLEALADLRARLAPEGFSVEAMADVGAGTELIVGCRRDPRFGPLVLVGLGGVYAEVLRDVAVALAPAGADELEELLLGLRGAGVLTGARWAFPARRPRRCGGSGDAVPRRRVPSGDRRDRGQPAARDAGRSRRARRASCGRVTRPNLVTLCHKGSLGAARPGPGSDLVTLRYKEAVVVLPGARSWPALTPSRGRAPRRA